MDNSQGNKPSQPPQYRPHEPSLDMLSLAEWLAEQRAAGDVPQLSALIAAMPDAAGDLADATMLDALVAEVEAEVEAEAGGLQVGEASVEGISEHVTPPALASGAQRAVADIFGAGDMDALAMVAETPSLYAVMVHAEAGAEVGLLALAHEQGMDADALAARIMLSPETLRWLDRVALPRDAQPDALVFHLVGALGLPRERVQEALTRGDTATDTDTAIGADASELVDVLTTSAALTPAQRAYWSARLAR